MSPPEFIIAWLGWGVKWFLGVLAQTMKGSGAISALQKYDVPIFLAR